MPSRLYQVARLLVSNPYAIDEEAREGAAARLAEADVAGEALSSLEDGDSLGAERLVLAMGHLRAVRYLDEPERVYDPKALPKKLRAALPNATGAYLRIVVAAARCRRALDALEGSSEAMHRVRREAWAACFGDSLVHALNLAQVIEDHDVLILGETGTGKEAIAHAIQEGFFGDMAGNPAPRSALNASAVPETLVESELFGHVKGAFTGAATTRKGRIRSAHRGCFFLDEVGDLQPTAQAKLLRVIETDEVHPVGSDEAFQAECRYVAATHKDLEAMVDVGAFRRDLYQRLAGNVLRLPPLRERPEDVESIGRAFVSRHLPDGPLEETRARLLDWLAGPEARRYPWPGNVRELQNALRNLLLGLDAGIDDAASAPLAGEGAADAGLPAPLRECTATLADVEDWYLARVLEENESNYAATARVLGVDRTTVRRRARKLRKKK